MFLGLFRNIYIFKALKKSFKIFKVICGVFNYVVNMEDNAKNRMDEALQGGRFWRSNS